MRSKYEVSPEARVANGTPTFEAFGVTFERRANVFDPYHVAKVTDDELIALWPRLTNEPFPGIANIGKPKHINPKSGEYEGPGVRSINGVDLFRNEGRKGSQDVPYTVLTVQAPRAAELIANGAVEGIKPQPAIAG